jgi:rhodanese-related sulfurtransferase
VSTPPVEIDPTAAAARATQGAVLLLDVREAEEWTAGHAQGALHVPLGRLDPAAVPTDRPIVAVCRSGARSGKAAELLAAAGVEAANLVGGMKAWADAGLPVVRADGSPGTVA